MIVASRQLFIEDNFSLPITHRLIIHGKVAGIIATSPGTVVGPDFAEWLCASRAN
jgi:hypothetical protein